MRRRFVVIQVASFLLIAAGSMLFLTSCKSGSSGPTIQTIKWQSDGAGYIRFDTNDSQYYGEGFWEALTEENQATMTTVTAEVIKEAGSLAQGYGIVFCYQDDN